MKTVRNAEGLYLNPTGAMGQPRWGKPQFAACYPDADAEAIAAAFGGFAAPVPTFDTKAKVWR